ncbi:hypothetical protein N7474_010707 [Penicillium riverlandense]|uniref:uncharacterized protein n=1 Tax=Penicillium riverlandense TaxID=1903569 RepID=UPI0025480EC3|nr:uncharacterized protein N7474_010707 [Penicillium riverlandense]KAJ5804820.1 hypothetical protein N7474_010707 [Penicillium riverlandense]
MPSLFDQFTSTFPTFNPASHNKARKDPWNITQADWNHAPIPSYIVPNVSAVAKLGFKKSHFRGRLELRISMRRLQDYTPRLRTGLRDSVTGDNDDRLKDALPLAQTLLLLMAMSTWGDPAVFCNEPASLQSVLACFVREEKLLQTRNLHIAAWPEWIHAEGLKRTAAIIFCFFNFHTIIYNTPPPILNSELNISLPSREADWEAQTESAWREARKGFEQYSSLGGYVLILALIQQIYLLRELNKMKPKANGDMSSLDEMDVNNMELALRNWQVQWENNPESSLQPSNSSGPVSFNSTALLRMAYIRLHVDVGPWRALGDQDPQILAQTIHQSPRLRRSPKLTSTVLYSAHALSIPVKLGVNTVAHNQAFTWSLQHSLCALECAFVISKWLDTLGSDSSSTSLDEDELRLLAYITDMVGEADSLSEQWQVEGLERSPIELCSHVIRIWSRILSGETIWSVVHMVGQALKAYCHILDEQLNMA